MPAKLIFPTVQGNKSEIVEDYVANLEQEISHAHEVARAKLKTTLKRMKRNYDLRILTRAYEEGDAVYVLDTATIKGQCKKLSSPWKCPGLIVQKISAYIYRVNLRNTVFVTNHDRLKPCRNRQLPKWIVEYKVDPQVVKSNNSEEVYCTCRKP